LREKTPANLLALGVPKKKEEMYYGKLQQICGRPVVTAHQICFQRDPDDLQDRKECIVPKKKEKRVTKKIRLICRHPVVTVHQNLFPA